MTFVTAKHNPFTIDRVHAIPFHFAHGGWEHHLARLRQMKWRGAIVGRRGSGKSTLLRQLQERLEQANRNSLLVKIPHNRNYKRDLEQALDQRQSHILLIDGMERMRLRDRWRMWRETMKQAGLVVARHQRSSLPTWIHCSTDYHLMETVLQNLNLQSPGLNEIAHELFDQYRGNIRLVLRELYDRCSDGRIDMPTATWASP